MRILRPFIRMTSGALMTAYEATLLSPKMKHLADDPRCQRLMQLLPLSLLDQATEDGRPDFFMLAFQQKYPLPKNEDPITHLRQCRDMALEMKHDGWLSKCYQIAVVSGNFRIPALIGDLIYPSYKMMIGLLMRSARGETKMMSFVIWQMLKNDIEPDVEDTNKLSRVAAKCRTVQAIHLLQKHGWLSIPNTMIALFGGCSKRRETHKNVVRVRKIAKFLIKRNTAETAKYMIMYTFGIVAYGDVQLLEQMREYIVVTEDFEFRMNELLRHAVMHGKITMVRLILSWCHPGETKFAQYAAQAAADLNRPKLLRILCTEYGVMIPKINTFHAERIKKMLK